MDEQDFCEGCKQQRTCKDVYEKLGRAQGPSVVRKVLIAFLLPIVVFIAVFAVSERILAGLLNAKELLPILSFLLAASAVAAEILIVRAIGKRVGRAK